MNLVEARGLVRIHGKGTGAEHRALDGIDLSIRPGEWVAIMGPSGSGKSTLLHLVALTDRPDAGTLALDGLRTENLSDAALTRLRRERLGHLHQAFHLLPTLDVLGNVRLPLDLQGAPSADAERRAVAMLEAVGLGHAVARHPSALSGGQQQRVALARALVHAPALVVADEPTGNLDRETGRAMLALIGSLVRTSGTGVLMVTHDPEVAAAADRCLLLVDGRFEA
ncbi:MAG: ABC transporter ATP-binding protein [Candidatus Sericytochromatia bacterium]|nr:ABC transporter ATP-binding protein [Candidatus Sericytochromatia bacterium]